MNTIKVNFDKTVGKIKPMHAVNNGPADRGVEQVRSNFLSYKAARFPYARNHDASLSSEYGGEHIVDVHAVFPDFSKDPDDPNSYDFTLTDDYLNLIDAAGAKVYYRLGSKIEHRRKRYGTVVPPDFKKWAVICEHIIRHYNYGWADGFEMNIEYWEIWNEPDGVRGDGYMPNWGGTADQFYEMYKICALHLKKCFPQLKIGGPALSCVNETWLKDFFSKMTEDAVKVPIDFIAWHSYRFDPHIVEREANAARILLDGSGYTETENHLNEWNYLENWTDGFIPSVEAIKGMRGAAYTGACMLMGQKSSLDMMMYYDARPCVFNGLFDYYTYRPLKGYYPFVMFSDLYELENETESASSNDELYVVSAAADGENRKKAIMITYYSADKNKKDKINVELNLSGGKVEGDWLLKTLNNEKTMEETVVNVIDGKAVLQLYPDTVICLYKS